MKLKKLFATALSLAMLTLAISSCGKTPVETTTTKGTETTGTSSVADTTTTTTSATETTTAETTTTTTTTTERAQYAFINDGEFDEANIVCSFGALSDTHQTGYSDAYSAKLRTAFATLKELSGGKLDAVAVAGDLTDAGTDTQITQFKRNFDAVFDKNETALIYTMGNHDAQTSSATSIARFRKILGEDYFKSDVDNSMIETGNRHSVVNGIHFICLSAFDYNGGGTALFDDKTVKWLDDTLASVTKENPDAPVMVIVHPMIYDTCYGSLLQTGTLGWFTKDLTETLSKYNQVITFSGHLHFPLNDERSIMQTAFTSVGCGSVRYMAIENGGYEKMSSATVMADREEFSQGLLVQVDKNGNTRLVRVDFYNENTIKTAWVVPAPKADGSHLTVYGKDRADNQSPVFASGKAVFTPFSTSKTAVYARLTFDTATDDDLIHDYVITMSNDETGERIKTFKILADFYKTPTVDGMSKTITQNLTGMKADITYKITIVANDSWGNSCEESFRVKADIAAGTVIVLD